MGMLWIGSQLFLKRAHGRGWKTRDNQRRNGGCFTENIAVLRHLIDGDV